jgi:hypothetical protein
MKGSFLILNGKGVHELDGVQVNILAIALDHMWEHLTELRIDGAGNIELIEERIIKLTAMQKTFGI